MAWLNKERKASLDGDLRATNVQRLSFVHIILSSGSLQLVTEEQEWVGRGGFFLGGVFVGQPLRLPGFTPVKPNEVKSVSAAEQIKLETLDRGPWVMVAIRRARRNALTRAEGCLDLGSLSRLLCFVRLPCNYSRLTRDDVRQQCVSST